MAVVIRLARMGKKGERKFRLVAKEKKSKRDGKPIEFLGWYEKGVIKETKKINLERVKYWVDHGAKLSPTAAKIIK